MATVPQEQVTQRNNKATVSITAGTDDDAGILQWLTTTVLPVTVTNTSAVSASYDTPAELEAAYATLDAAAATEQDLHADFGFGDDVGDQILVKLGNTTLTADNVAASVATKDISAFVAGGFGSLHYAIDATTQADFGTSVMAGKTLVYTTTDTDTGADTVVINVTDDTGTQVQVTCEVTVA
jgi:hypothetical protein